MRLSFKRALAGVVGLAAAASLVPIAMASPAAAAPQLAGVADVSPNSSSDSSVPFNINLPAGSSCPGDSANDGWRVTSYMIAKSVDPATLVFDSNGPVNQQFSSPQATFVQPLYDTTGSPYVQGQTANADSPPGPGPILLPPTGTTGFSFNVYEAPPFDVPPGQYNIGIACVLPSGPTYPIDRFWNNTITITSNPADPGNADISWTEGTPANTPNVGTPTPGNQECTVAVSDNSSTPPATSFTATANPGGFTASGPAGDLTITGLTNNTGYTITVVANNGIGDSAPSAGQPCTPVADPRTNVTNVAVLPGSPGSGEATVSWTPPGANNPAATPSGYEVVVTGPTSSTQVVTPGTATSVLLTGLAPGSYTVAVTAQYTDPPTTGTVPATTPVSFSIAGSGLPGSLLQDITVVRPDGALVLTQVCGVRAAQDPVPAGTYTGFPDPLPGITNADSSTVETPTAAGEAPTTGAEFNAPGPGGTPDGRRGDYPYPTDANGVPQATYPTHCGLDLQRARFVTRGPGAGQYFAANGILDQVTVVETRNDTPTWTATGTMSEFVSTTDPNDFFSGSQLGWIPQRTEDTGPFEDSNGNTYDQVVNAGDDVAPGVANLVGLSTGKALATAPVGSCVDRDPVVVIPGGRGNAQACTGALGTAILDARLLLLIPVTADAGTYRGTLTITAA